MRITVPMLAEGHTNHEASLHDSYPISAGAARTIAGWWASPGMFGRHLAALSTGCEVDTVDVLHDIASTLSVHWNMAASDKVALKALADFTMNVDELVSA